MNTVNSRMPRTYYSTIHQLMRPQSSHLKEEVYAPFGVHSNILTNFSYNSANHSLHHSCHDKSQQMKESIAMVQEDKFSNLEKKYIKKTSSHISKHPRMATATTRNEDSNTDDSDFSSLTSAPSTVESTDNASQVFNSKVSLTKPITSSLFSLFFLQIAAILPSKVPPAKKKFKYYLY